MRKKNYDAKSSTNEVEDDDDDVQILINAHLILCKCHKMHTTFIHLINIKVFR